MDITFFASLIFATSFNFRGRIRLIIDSFCFFQSSKFECLTPFELSSRFIFAYMSLLLDGVEWLMRFCWEKKSVETKLFYYDDDRYFWWESVKLSSSMYLLM